MIMNVFINECVLLVVFINFVIISESDDKLGNVKSELSCLPSPEQSSIVLSYPTWDDYKQALNKTYGIHYLEERRRKAYEKNVEFIKEHNRLFADGLSTFKLRANNLADLPNQIYLKRFVRLTKNPHFKTIKDGERVATFSGNVLHNLPETFDWRDKGYNTVPDNQRSCGSCYAFSIVHSIQGQILQRIGKLIELSEQQIVDCSVQNGNHGCAGGSLRNTLGYLEKYGGLMRREDYPYTATQGRCKFDHNLAIINVTSWSILPPREENNLKVAIATIGPIAVSLNASPATFQLYSDGIYNDDNCSSNFVNHAMLLIGYTNEFWILKNWWGKNWGELGYMRLARGKNLCGIANYAAYGII